MAESMRLPNFVASTPIDDKFRFHTTDNWDPDAAGDVNAIHVVVSGNSSAAFVPAADKQVVQLGVLPGNGVTT